MNDKFAAFYSTFMPGLLTILKDTPMETKNQKELRSNCIQAIGCILESVADKPEVCHADAREVTQIITELMNSGKLDDSDPQILTIQRTLSQLAAVLKHDFKPYLPAIMQSLLKDARADVDLKIVDVNEADIEEGEGSTAKKTSINIEIKGQEGQK